MRTKKAFTLIELLVVVAIIAVLIAILLPSLQEAREAAKTAVCLSSTRQLGIAFTNYIINNYGFVVPIARDWGGQNSTNVDAGFISGPLWYDRLRSEKLLTFSNDDPKILRCPSHVQRGGYFDMYPNRLVSYASNRFVSGADTDNGNWWKIRKIESFDQSPSNVIMLGERGPVSEPIGFPWSVGGSNFYWWSGYDARYGYGVAWNRHNKGMRYNDGIMNGKSVMLMCDGHGAAVTASFVWENSVPSGDGEGITYNRPDIPGVPYMKPMDPEYYRNY